jgi:phosphotransferase system HPr-like phosphotransfer protein
VKITAEGPDEEDAAETLQGLLAGPGEPVGE